jgi:hypothetical protein
MQLVAVASPGVAAEMDLGHCPWIPMVSLIVSPSSTLVKNQQNLILYTYSILHRRSDRYYGCRISSMNFVDPNSSHLNGFQNLVKSWQEWDSLTGLANYHSIVEILFGFLRGDLDLV